MPDSVRWLHQFAGSPRFGFVRRDGTGLLGVGIAESVTGESIAHVLADCERRGGTWFVGGSFDPRRERDAWWKPFGAAQAWRADTTVSLPSHASSTQTTTPTMALRERGPALGRYPDRAEWKRLVEQVISGIQAGIGDKVVLARSIVEATQTDAVTWLHGPRRPREMAFVFEPEPGVAFAGLTPELLYDRHGDTVRSEALAGTDVDTADGRARLLASDKDALEHGLVVQAVTDALTPLCTSLNPSPLQLAATGRLVHRLVTFEGRLTKDVGDAMLAESLHPTPAVAGTPKRAAVGYLRHNEPFDRGWYAGPIGLVEPGRTTLSVALRCALWLGSTRISYAGAGIVAGSKAEAEWDETELKSRAVRDR